MKIGAVILTARASRVSRDIPLKTELDTLREAGVGPVVVVTGHEEELVRKGLSHRRVRFVRNPDPREGGMFESIRLGLEELRGRCDKAVIVNGDTPSFSAGTIRAITESEGEAVFPEYGGDTGHPFCLDMRIADTVTAFAGGGGIKEMIRNGLLHPTILPVDDPGIHLQADAEDNLREAIRYQRDVLLSEPVRAEVRFGIARKDVFFDETLAELLTEIDRCRSMNLACKRLGMAYSRGWKMIRRAEEMLDRTLVSRQTGGTGGGGSILTEDGRRYLAGYRMLRREVAAFAEDALQRFLCGDERTPEEN